MRNSVSSSAKSQALPDLFGQVAQLIEHPQAYAGTPGRGPAGKQCRHCDEYTRFHVNARVHLKCGRNKHRWTRGPGSDIKAGTPACEHFN